MSNQVPEVHVDWYMAKSPLPEIDDKGIALAKTMPGEKVAYFDAKYPVETSDDLRTLQGFRVVGEDGTFTGEEWRNPGFVPHPDTARTKFHTNFELELWRTITGYLTLGPFVRALAGAELMAMVNDRGELEIRPNEHGDATLDVHTSLRPRTELLAALEVVARQGCDRSPWSPQLAPGHPVQPELPAAAANARANADQAVGRGDRTRRQRHADRATSHRADGDGHHDGWSTAVKAILSGALGRTTHAVWADQLCVANERYDRTYPYLVRRQRP